MAYRSPTVKVNFSGSNQASNLAGQNLANSSKIFGNITNQIAEEEAARQQQANFDQQMAVVQEQKLFDRAAPQVERDRLTNLRKMDSAAVNSVIDPMKESFKLSDNNNARLERGLGIGPDGFATDNTPFAPQTSQEAGRESKIFNQYNAGVDSIKNNFQTYGNVQEIQRQILSQAQSEGLSPERTAARLESALSEFPVATQEQIDAQLGVQDKVLDAIMSIGASKQAGGSTNNFYANGSSGGVKGDKYGAILDNIKQDNEFGAADALANMPSTVGFFQQFYEKGYTIDETVTMASVSKYTNELSEIFPGVSKSAFMEATFALGIIDDKEFVNGQGYKNILQNENLVNGIGATATNIQNRATTQKSNNMAAENAQAENLKILQGGLANYERNTSQIMSGGTRKTMSEADRGSLIDQYVTSLGGTAMGPEGVKTAAQAKEAANSLIDTSGKNKEKIAAEAKEKIAAEKAETERLRLAAELSAQKNPELTEEQILDNEFKVGQDETRLPFERLRSLFGGNEVQSERPFGTKDLAPGNDVRDGVIANRVRKNRSDTKIFNNEVEALKTTGTTLSGTISNGDSRIFKKAVQELQSEIDSEPNLQSRNQKRTILQNLMQNDPTALPFGGSPQNSTNTSSIGNNKIFNNANFNNANLNNTKGLGLPESSPDNRITKMIASTQKRMLEEELTEIAETLNTMVEPQVEKQLIERYKTVQQILSQF